MEDLCIAGGIDPGLGESVTQGSSNDQKIVKEGMRDDIEAILGDMLQ